MKPFKLLTKILIAASVVWPTAAFAQSDTQAGLNFIRFLFSFGGLTGSRTLMGFLAKIISLLLSVAGTLAVLFVIIGGYWYITSAGNEARAEKGKKTLLNAIIGVIIVVLSFVIISVVVNTANSGSGIRF